MDNMGLIPATTGTGQSITINIMIIAGKPEVFSPMQAALAAQEFRLFLSPRDASIFQRIHKNAIHLVIIELIKNDARDLELLAEIKNADPRIEVILSGPPQFKKSMVEAIKHGALDFLPAPLDIAALQVPLEQIRERVRLRRETFLLEQELGKKYLYQDIVGKAPAMLEIFSLLERVSRHDVTVLIGGETGTGKEMIAQAIHRLSPRNTKALVTCDCSTIPGTLFESELFGHSKGAFTGADTARVGLFKEADQGTIFLDEIAEIPIKFQAKLLRVLEERKVRPLGVNHKIDIDVRLISSTNRDLRASVALGNFREDLFHRLNVVEIHLPPLRDRREDLPLLCHQFLDKFNRKFNKDIRGLSARAQRVLALYPWPGNVRELLNLMERSVMLCRESFIDSRDLPPHIQACAADNAMNKNLAGPGAPLLNLLQIEKKHILDVLAKTGASKKETARLLGITRPALYRKLNKLHIPL
jgi:DNA-binding NtrC family response regulator